MKKILIPTDFSENATKALNYAIVLANEFKATLHVLHTFQSTSHAGRLANVDRLIKEDRDKEMDDLLDDLKSKYQYSLDIKGRCRKGYTVEVIEDEITKVEAELVVMGTQGASSIGKKIMGSTTSNLIKDIDTPILVIPNEAKDINFEHLVVALDALDNRDVNVLEPMLDFAKTLNLPINLLHVSSGSYHTDIDPDIKEYITQNGMDFSYDKVQSNDVLEGILDYAGKKSNSLLCLVSRERNWFESLFRSSISQQIALQSDIPLLVLHDVAE
ncbi:MAG: universal stress protein [Saprospiraceae bacterium]|nr:universal stress protein [Saprospiraceae bacterium]